MMPIIIIMNAWRLSVDTGFGAMAACCFPDDDDDAADDDDDDVDVAEGEL